MDDAAQAELHINTIRFLAVDAVEQAKSGHPGAPMGMAPLAYVLWDRFLKHNPADPQWVNRDRFILSAGHASALLYALLYLTGYGVSLEDLRQFRQWGSKTPGHPEYGVTPGVECTTGPLGQGFANGVGMAMAERWLARQYNRPGYEIIDHYTYALASDGDLMEGVSAEAASLAGTLRLGKLIYLYDDNGISIEGDTDMTFTEDVSLRFRAYGWQVIGPVDGLDLDAIGKAIGEARAEHDRPSLIICRTVIGYGSPHKANTAAAHGEPLGEEEVRLAKKRLSCDPDKTFCVRDEVLAYFRRARERGPRWQQEWELKFQDYREAFPGDYRQLLESLRGELPDGWDAGLEGLFPPETKPVSTREASGKVLNIVAGRVPYILGGSADLAPSTKTLLKDYPDFSAQDYGGRNIRFGVREHAMGAVSNGMALHRGVIPYTATFLIFYDYMRPPVRLAALMGLPVIFIFSHDSIGLGEDGPTHQPIEQLTGLRAVPNLVTIRPADATETVEAWKIALGRHDGPTVLVFSRQSLPVFNPATVSPACGLQHGGYILWEATPRPEVILIGTGSEVHIALEAGKMLQEKKVPARVVSLPSWELFEAQPEEYRQKVLPPGVTARVVIEAASPLGWERYAGSAGRILGINRFGASAPGKVIYEKLGLTAAHVVAEALDLLNGGK
ncbi:MAG: transketolase [Chloroflexota bacterium]